MQPTRRTDAVRQHPPRHLAWRPLRPQVLLRQRQRALVPKIRLVSRIPTPVRAAAQPTEIRRGCFVSTLSIRRHAAVWHLHRLGPRRFPLRRRSCQSRRRTLWRKLGRSSNHRRAKRTRTASIRFSLVTPVAQLDPRLRVWLVGMGITRVHDAATRTTKPRRLPPPSVQLLRTLFRLLHPLLQAVSRRPPPSRPYAPRIKVASTAYFNAQAVVKRTEP